MGYVAIQLCFVSQLSPIYGIADALKLNQARNRKLHRNGAMALIIDRYSLRWGEMIRERMLA